MADLTDEKFEKVAKQAYLMQGLASRYRIEILLLLENGERSLSCISRELKLSRAAAAHHLDVLTDRGMVSERRTPGGLFYTSQFHELNSILAAIAATPRDNRRRRPS